MKITGPPPLAPTTPTEAVAQSGDGARSAATPMGDSVKLSRHAAFVADAVASADPSPFRSDLVDQVKAELQAGTFEANTDLDAALEGLLTDL